MCEGIKLYMFVAVVWANIVLIASGPPTSSLSRSVLDLASPIESPSLSTTARCSAPRIAVEPVLQRRLRGNVGGLWEAALVPQAVHAHDDLSHNTEPTCASQIQARRVYYLEGGIP